MKLGKKKNSGSFEGVALRGITKEYKETELLIEGKLPHWIKGTFVRNGPAYFCTDTSSVSHWFDGLAMLHSYTIEDGKCIYSNRFLETNALQQMKEGIISGGFSETTPIFFEKIEHEFHPYRPNANVHTARFNKEYVALTEDPTPVTFDLKSLETKGIFTFEDTLSEKKYYESAHVHICDEETYSYLVEIGKESAYVLYKLVGNSRQLIARIPIDTPSYVHSFSTTEKYLIFVEYPFVIDFKKIMEGRGFIRCFEWQKDLGSHFYVVDRKTGHLVSKVKGPPFFSFHHINAFEKGGEILVDLISYSHSDMIFGKETPDSGIKRYSVPLDGTPAKELFCIPINGADLPRIHYEKYNGKPYRYVYAVDLCTHLKSEQKTPPLLKVDMEMQTVATYSIPAYFPSEPIFIPNPEGMTEDDGAILSVMTRGDHSQSFLLILDGKSFKEIGRASLPHGVPQGLHGNFFPASDDTP